MPGKFLAAILLVFGGGVTLYVLYKTALAVLQPVVQKKLEQEMQAEKKQQLQNNLQLHQPENQPSLNDPEAGGKE